MIVTDHQDVLTSWLCSRIGLVPTPGIRCIGRVVNDKLVGVVGFDGYNRASIAMHVAGEGRWINREFLFAAFDYPFNVCKVNVLIGLVSSSNKNALKLNTNLGFKVEHTIVGADPDGDTVIMTMTQQECRFLKEYHGKKLRTSTGS